MSSSPPVQPTAPSSSSPARASTAPIASSRLQAQQTLNPQTRAYLITGGGQNILVVLSEARQWFQLGYEVRDPVTREFVDVGAVPIPDFAFEFEGSGKGGGKKTGVKKEGGEKMGHVQMNGFINGGFGNDIKKGDHNGGGGAGAGAGVSS